jgi:hypothetical protein
MIAPEGVLVYAGKRDSMSVGPSKRHWILVLVTYVVYRDQSYPLISNLTSMQTVFVLVSSK